MNEKRLHDSGEQTYPPHSHDELYLSWHHQGDGFNYFECSICHWKKPDPKCSAILKLVEEETRELKSKAKEDIKIVAQEAFKLRDEGLKAVNQLESQLAELKEILKNDYEWHNRVGRYFGGNHIEDAKAKNLLLKLEGKI